MRSSLPSSFVRMERTGACMLSSRLRRRFVIFGIALFAVVQGSPYCNGRSIMNLDGAVSLQNERAAQTAASKAGFIFSGTVVSIDRINSAAGVGIEAIRVTFA